MKLSETKRNFTCYETKRNEILPVTKRNETKFRKICCFAKHAKFRETGDEFRLVSCFAKLKKRAKLETLLVGFKPSLSFIGAKLINNREINQWRSRRICLINSSNSLFLMRLRRLRLRLLPKCIARENF
jgi:hypothetical protein